MYHADTEQVNKQGENRPWNHHFRKENLQQGDSNRENALEKHYSGAFICVN